MDKTKSQTMFRDSYSQVDLLHSQNNHLMNSHNLTQSNNTFTYTNSIPAVKRLKIEENEYTSGNINFSNMNNNNPNNLYMINNMNTGSNLGYNGIQTPNYEEIYSTFDVAGQFYNPNVNNIGNYQPYGNYFPTPINDIQNLNSNLGPFLNINEYYYGLNSNNFNNGIGVDGVSTPQPSQPSNLKIQIKTLNNDEYVFVNPKQYQRILQRREKRRKLNLGSRFISKENCDNLSNSKPKYIHESRHKHAMTRQRGKGGRFVAKKETAGIKIKIEKIEK